MTGFYIDDTPLPDSLDPRVLDVDRIEVLRGPQGTLYGARSMGGVVRIITKEPDLDNFSATLHGGVSDTERTTQPNYTGDAVVNIPLLQDHVALRVSGFYDTEAGILQAQLLHRSGGRNEPHLHAVGHHGHHHGRQRSRHQHLRRSRGPYYQAHRLADHHAARHAAEGHLQRLPDGGLPLDAR